MQLNDLKYIRSHIITDKIPINWVVSSTKMGSPSLHIRISFHIIQIDIHPEITPAFLGYMTLGTTSHLNSGRQSRNLFRVRPVKKVRALKRGVRVVPRGRKFPRLLGTRLCISIAKLEILGPAYEARDTQYQS
jgi:hypothetical protein